MKPRTSSTKGPTPRQRVLAKYPKAYSQWMPGAGMWRIVEAVAGETYGFTVKLAWANTARTLPPTRCRKVTFDKLLAPCTYDDSPYLDRPHPTYD